MILGKKTLEKLRELINEETEYRSGPNLVKFFNELGFNDSYGQGFPSRWMYTDSCLEQLNGTPELDKCIYKAFSPIDFIERSDQLDKFIEDFNKYLAFDKWKLLRNGAEISFKKLDKIDFAETKHTPKADESTFLNQEFNDLDLRSVNLDGMITEALEYRLSEIEKCFSSEAPLSVILLAGSTLEGLLLGIASKHPKHFNTCAATPKNKEGKVKQFHEWSLSNFIDVSKEAGLLERDVQKFSHALRDFRNYIHPFEQVSSRFNPTMHTAKICLQVLKVAVHQIGKNINKFNA